MVRVIHDNCNHLQRHSRRFAVRTSVAICLLRHRYPRFAVGAALALAGSVGFGCSYSLWCWGLTAMWLRYPLALSGAYITFLALLGMLAVRAARHLDKSYEVRRDSRRRQFHSDDSELPDADDFFDKLPDVSDDNGENLPEPGGVPAFLLLLMSATVVVACLYFVWMAPVLIAEIVVEGALVASLYRPHMRGANTNWFSVAVEQTGLSALLMAFCLALTGIGFQLSVPQATNVVDVWNELARTKATPE